MWTISDLKERGKIAFKRNYWRCLFASFLIMLLVGGSGGSSSGSDYSNSGKPDYTDGFFEQYEDMTDEQIAEIEDSIEQSTIGALETQINAHQGLVNMFSRFLPAGISSLVSGILLGVAGLIIVLLVVVVLIFNIVVSNVIEVGGCRFFVKNSFEPVSIGELFWGFRNGRYVNLVVTQFLRGLFTFLWSLLFVIPGIVKTYEYRMIPYILAENPDMPWRDAFAESKRMMYGQKMNAFILDFSFIGWNFLSALTLGIVGLFYSNPYEMATDAELFLTLNGGFDGELHDYQQRWQDAYENGTVWEEAEPSNQGFGQNGQNYGWNQDDRTYYQHQNETDGWNSYIRHTPDEYEPHNPVDDVDDDRTYR